MKFEDMIRDLNYDTLVLLQIDVKNKLYDLNDSELDAPWRLIDDLIEKRINKLEELGYK